MQVARVFDWCKTQGLVELNPALAPLGEVTLGAPRVAHLSDTHLGKGDKERRFKELERWLALFKAVGVQVVVHTGDLVEEPTDREEVERAFELFEQVGLPVLGVPGNHDVQIPGEQSAVSRRWGPFPRREEVQGACFWLFDTMAGLPVQERADWERLAAEEAGFYSRGALGAEQLRAWEEMIRDGLSAQPHIVVLHHHLRQPVPEKPWYEENEALMAPLLDADRVLDLAQRTGAGLILHGHRHQYTSPYSPRPGIVVLNGGSSTPEEGPWRARILDLETPGGARIWEVVRW